MEQYLMVGDPVRKEDLICQGIISPETKLWVKKFDQDNHDRGQQELVILKKLQGHNNVVALYCSATTAEHTKIYMEFFELTLARARICCRRFTYDKVSYIAHQILSGVAFCHANGIVHGCVKPENVCLSGMTVKLVGFGSARTFDYRDIRGCSEDVLSVGVIIGGMIKDLLSFCGTVNRIWKMQFPNCRELYNYFSSEKFVQFQIQRILLRMFSDQDTRITAAEAVNNWPNDTTRYQGVVGTDPSDSFCTKLSGGFDFITQAPQVVSPNRFTDDSSVGVNGTDSSTKASSVSPKRNRAVLSDQDGNVPNDMSTVPGHKCRRNDDSAAAYATAKENEPFS